MGQRSGLLRPLLLASIGLCLFAATLRLCGVLPVVGSLSVIAFVVVVNLYALWVWEGD